MYWLFNNCVAYWRWVPRMSMGFHFWQSQPLDRVMPSWLVNPHLPTISPHAMPKGPLSWPLSLERRGSWLGEAWALYFNLGGIHYFLKGISDKLELSSFQKMYSMWRYLVKAKALALINVRRVLEGRLYLNRWYKLKLLYTWSITFLSWVLAGLEILSIVKAYDTNWNTQSEICNCGNV